ncbi:hypothetical protein ACFLU6_08765, partial [Acidobacteriota bacterium]
LLLLGFLAPQGAYGQAPDERQARKERRKEMRGRYHQMRDQEGSMNETVMLLFLDKMRKDLDLTNEQTLEILPLFEEVEKSRAAHHKEQRTLLKDLRALVKDPDSSDSDMLKTMRRIEDSEKGFKIEEARIRKEIESKLSVRQQAHDSGQRK